MDLNSACDSDSVVLVCTEEKKHHVIVLHLAMSARSVFSESEKTCLMELIVKYKLQKPCTLTSASQSAKKVLWQRLTQEFNAIEGNSKRTETQLKKCWDNLKTRQKGILAEEKRERMRTGGGQYRPNELQPGTSGVTLVAEALCEQTDVEIEGVFDSDTIHMSEDAVLVEPVEESEHWEIPAVEASPQQSHHDTPPRDTPPHPPLPSQPRHPVSQLTDFGAAPLRGPRNIRSKVIEEEFAVRQQAYKTKEKREEELFEIQKKEKIFMMMAAEQTYLKVKAEKEAAEAKRELAEFELKIKKNND